MCDESFVEKLSQNSRFTGCTTRLIQIFDKFKADPDNTAADTLLQILPILEFSLGNVYLSKTRQTPPHLLKDLLQEIEIVIDKRHVSQ